MPVPSPEMAPVSNDSPEVRSLAERITGVFNRCFADPRGLNTRLRGGFSEPYYRPAGEVLDYHQVEFTHDYAASALHEAAHWCVAGEARRQLPDYGYWYAPDGRSAEQQAEFELVEVKPQALEWIFARACGLRFRVSADNLQSDLGPSDRFMEAIWQQVLVYCAEGPSARARTFAMALALEFEQSDPLYGCAYQLAELS
ncbi:elongation factor P hydroxylase [Microbulbifer echini]|uniref:Elongation factor P hydroxylase n=1 Tax=Microbulbifer echini TaxID=1529067 RepID=A0ABV4NS54_9GAMM|nr:elongation factor P hydroxylase [uncultured Microbulbifer sp.]